MHVACASNLQYRSDPYNMYAHLYATLRTNSSSEAD